MNLCGEPPRTVLMIDFENGSLFKLSPVDPETLMPRVGPLLVEGESIVAAFKALRDSVVFTNKRVISYCF